MPRPRPAPRRSPTIRASRSMRWAARPGSYSARYAGRGADDAANNAKLHRARCAACRASGARARYRCVLVFLERPRTAAPLIAEGVLGRLDPRGRAAAAASATTRISGCPSSGDGRRARRRRRIGSAIAAGRCARCARVLARARTPHEQPRDVAAAGPVRAHAVVRAQMPVLRLQFASAEDRALPAGAYIDA